jgi:hypothetical protein
MLNYQYTVIVGNIGTVYFGADKKKANQIFDEYVGQSESGRGRASGETVTLFDCEEILREHFGKNIPD